MKAQPHFSRRLVRTKEAARYLGMSPGKVRRITQCGELPVIQHDEHAPWLYDLCDLDSYIDKSKHRLTDFS
jgi:helix-turn-helix protein